MFNTIFQDIILDIESQGQVSQPRDLKVKELAVDMRAFDPRFTIADFENRKFNFKYFAGELAWYLLQDRDINYISQFSGFWKGITNPNTNEINSNYGSLLFGDQLKWVIESLEKDKNSRQAIAFLNQPKFQFEGNKDFVCTMYMNFYIRDNQLNMKVQMRSNDIFYGLTFDAPFFSFVYQHVLLQLQVTYPELETGTYYHCADNIHFYERHFELADKIKNERALNRTIELKVKAPLFTITNSAPYYNITETGKAYINEVDMLAKNPDATQADYKELLHKYILV
jgi:thymidylate synthase